MALFESFYRKIGRQNALGKIVFISANTSCAGGKAAKHYSKASKSHNMESWGPDKSF